MNALRGWGSIVGGLLVITGAILPWLTLDAGLQRYGGTTGVFGWLVVAAGAFAFTAGVRELRAPAQWMPAFNTILGFGLCIFALWLLIGVDQFVHRPDAAMLVPGPGPGLFVVIAGAGVMIACELGARASSLRQRLLR